MREVTQNERAWDELKNAVEIYKRIDSDPNPNPTKMESSIRDIVIKLDLIWKYTLGSFKNNSKFHNENGKFKKIRDEDHLLSYLDAARDVIQHTSQSLIDNGPLKLTILNNSDFKGEPTEGPDIQMEWVSKSRLGFKLKEDIKLQLVWAPQFTPITNFRSKITYLPPRTHMGQDISEYYAPEQTLFALQWYERYLLTIDKLFPHVVPE